MVQGGDNVVIIQHKLTQLVMLRENNTTLERDDEHLLVIHVASHSHLGGLLKGCIN